MEEETQEEAGTQVHVVNRHYNRGGGDTICKLGLSSDGLELFLWIWIVVLTIWPNTNVCKNGKKMPVIEARISCC